MSERDAIVAWLRTDAHQASISDCSAIADAIERGDHLPASVADRHGDSHIATHAGEVERLREALRRIASSKTELSDKSDYARGWNDARFTMGQIVRQALEASR